MSSLVNLSYVARGYYVLSVLCHHASDSCEYAMVRYGLGEGQDVESRSQLIFGKSTVLPVDSVSTDVRRLETAPPLAIRI